MSNRLGVSAVSKGGGRSGGDLRPDRSPSPLPTASHTDARRLPSYLRDVWLGWVGLGGAIMASSLSSPAGFTAATHTPSPNTLTPRAVRFISMPRYTDPDAQLDYKEAELEGSSAPWVTGAGANSEANNNPEGQATDGGAGDRSSVYDSVFVAQWGRSCLGSPSDPAATDWCVGEVTRQKRTLLTATPAH